ncbi:uncharacterized protein LOC109834849 [Asparagus officinalis]|uniref:uncharacterized protein LOC109834849 n=1 Tax=Asparagus officinalis TaxID=4686 RepID=UPI00098E78A6|nr:uncharacterized protein LOC109834849 [Asparagus officinalis]
MNTVRTLMSVATNYDWPLFQMDVRNAFLQGDLEEEVYMDLPPGLPMPRESGLICGLKKAIYGLKQSPRAWYGSDLSGIETLKHHLSLEFDVKGLGNLKYFLGIEIAHSHKGLFLSQRKYALDLLRETGRGILMRKHGHVNIVGYTNADWAGSLLDRKSTTGFYKFVRGNAVTWKSNKQ